MTWLATLSWFLVGLYGVFYNISYIDEAKYLIKGWLMTTGQIGYYSTPEFFYQHMPGGLLWFGLGQKLFGPNLLVARLQSLALSGLIFWLTFTLTKTILGKTAGKLGLLVLSLMPVVCLYYSSAVPQALVITTLLLAFIALAKRKYLWSSFWFTLVLIVRENFIFTLGLYLLFLIWQLKNVKEIGKNLAVIAVTLLIFILPGWPGILTMFSLFPGLKTLLDLPKIAQDPDVIHQVFDLPLYFTAIKEFVGIYLSFLLSFLWALIKIRQVKLPEFKLRLLYFLLAVAGFNFFAHVWGAFNSSPRAIVSYMAYIGPLLAVITAVLISNFKQSWLKVYPVLLVIALISIKFASIPGGLKQPTHLQQINNSVSEVKQLTAGKDKIIWLAEPITLYLSGKISYYPLINHTNFFRSSTDTQAVRRLGFWNQEIMKGWLNEADFVVVDANRLAFLEQKSPEGKSTATMIRTTLEDNFTLVTPNNYIWPGNLSFYLPNNIATTF